MRQLTLSLVTFASLLGSCGSETELSDNRGAAGSNVMIDGSQDLNLSPNADATVVEFRIKANTGSGNWNSAATEAVVRIGQTLRIINEDSIKHRLHTNGKPCPHGPDFQAGTSFDCVVTKAYNRATDGDLYDHNVGPTAKFFLKVEPAATPTPSPTPTTTATPAVEPSEGI